MSQDWVSFKSLGLQVNQGDKAEAPSRAGYRGTEEEPDSAREVAQSVLLRKQTPGNGSPGGPSPNASTASLAGVCFLATLMSGRKDYLNTPPSETFIPCKTVSLLTQLSLWHEAFLLATRQAAIADFFLKRVCPSYQSSLPPRQGAGEWVCSSWEWGVKGTLFRSLIPDSPWERCHALVGSPGAQG